MSSPVAPKRRMAYFIPMMPALIVFLISPASPFDQKAVANGVALLTKWGLNIAANAEKREHSLSYLNGSDEQRLAELQHAMTTPDCDLVWLTRGGYGLTRILSSLKLPEGKTPVVVGFSDATALLFHLWHHRRAKGIHAPTLAKIDQEETESLEALSLILQSRAREIKWPTLRKLFWPHKESTIEGELLAANLCVLTHLIGTPSMPSLEGSILVLEEIGERPYRIDRMLTQLEASGSLRGVKAIVLGHLTGCNEPGDDALTPESVVLERCKRFGIALCAGLPVGHVSPNWAVPFGVRSRLIASDHAELEVLEEIF